MKVLSYHGDRDGIRWGDLGLGNHRRRFVLDLFTGQVRLYQMDHRGMVERTEDTDPAHIEQARKALAAKPMSGL